MGWTWPSWTAIGLGTIGLVTGIVLLLLVPESGVAGTLLAGPLLMAGGILLAAGLHSLQGAYTACCDDWCDDGGCGCGHCDGCKGGECCGHCGCRNEVPHEHGPGGHQH